MFGEMSDILYLRRELLCRVSLQVYIRRSRLFLSLFMFQIFFAFGLREDLLLFYGSTPLATEEELGGVAI